MVRIAVIQMGIKPLDKEYNISKAEAFIRRARGKADIVVLPEQFATGPLIDNDNEKHAEHDGSAIRRLSIAAKTNSISILAGSIIEKEGKEFYNRSYLIDKHGKITGAYDKINLWDDELDLTPGKATGIFETEFGRIGVLICWDILRSDIFKEMKRKKVDIVLCPSLWWVGSEGKGTKYNGRFSAEFIDSMCMTRAYESMAYFVFANAAERLYFSSFSDDSVGHSQIVGPFVNVAGMIKTKKEGMLIRDIDLGVLKDARDYFGGHHD